MTEAEPTSHLPAPTAAATDVDRIVGALDRHLAGISNDPRLMQAQHTFREHGFAKAGFLAPPAVKASVAVEAETLIAERGIRRDLIFAETGHTPRRMRNVRRREIRQYGHVLPAVYSSAVLRRVLGHIAGEQISECPYEPEQYVITELSGRGDTHGWHWDDYTLALVWVIECPPLSDGGFVQCVPNTTWNKTNPELHRQFVDHPIYSAELLAGDLYVMRTNTVLHRVYPIRAGRRLIVNMAYAAPYDLGRVVGHETMDTLWEGSE